jgi:hypothetical protein
VDDVALLAGDAEARIHGMTQALDTLIAKLEQLPAEDQDRIAKWLAAELASEERWSKLFDQSQDALDEMADEALADLEAGRTRDLDPDRM